MDKRNKVNLLNKIVIFLLGLFLIFSNQNVFSQNQVHSYELNNLNAIYREGTYTISLKRQNTARSYFVYLPPAFDGTRRLPVVVAFHPELSSIDDFRMMTNLEEAAKRHNFILVMPQGLGITVDDITYGTWTVNRECCYLGLNDEVDDKAFISKLLDDVSLRFNIDTNRIYLTGHSLGGYFASVLACEMSEKIAALAVNNSSVEILGCLPNKSVPTFHHQSLKNDCMPFYGGLMIDTCQNRILAEKEIIDAESQKLDVIKHTDYIDSWKKYHSLETAQSIELPAKYTKCNIQTKTKRIGAFCTSAKIGHVWPKGQYGIACQNGNNELCREYKEVFGPLSDEFDFNEYMWQFFSEHYLDIFQSNLYRLESGQYQFTINVNATPRKYDIYVPKHYDINQPHSLIIALHPQGTTADEFMSATQFNLLAEKNSFIVVYPHAYYEEGLPRKKIGWNTQKCCGIAQELRLDDTAFIKAVIRDASSKFNVDKKRVYLTGFSNGADAVYQIGCAISEEVAAIAPVAGNMLDKSCVSKRKTPLLDIKIKDDECVPLQGKLCGSCLTDEKFSCPSARENMAKILESYECSNASQAFNLYDGIVEKFIGCPFTQEVSQYVVDSASHKWTNEISGKDFGISEIIWEFFQGHSIEDFEQQQLKQNIKSHHIIHQNFKRTFNIFVPDNYNADKAWPLIIALHGTGQTPEYFETMTHLNLQANKDQVIIAYPKSVKAFWDYFDHDHREIDDVGFLNAMVDDIVSKYTVDKNAVHILGYDSGALMAYRVACDSPSRYSAILAIGAHDLPGVCEPDKNIRIMHWHGKKDRVFPYDGGECRYTENIQQSCRSVDSYINEWADLNRCGWETEVAYTDLTTACIRYVTCQDDAAITLCYQDNADHNWPSGESTNQILLKLLMGKL